MLDCLFLLTVTEFEGKKILDIGCGPGFPTMPLKCYDPNFDITPLDSTGKRIKFIEESCAAQDIPVTENFSFIVNSFLNKIAQKCYFVK